MRFVFILSSMLLSTGTFAQGNIKIYDANMMFGLGPLLKKGKQVIENGKPLDRTAPKNALILTEQFEKIQNYYLKFHDRNSWDDNGADVEATINVRGVLSLLGMKQNAAWMGTIDEAKDLTPEDLAELNKNRNRFIFGKGKKDGLDRFEEALDVVAHEYTHAVIETTSKLKYVGQSGALNEHLADVFGVLINKHNNNPSNPYLIGASILPKQMKHRGLRDMENPEKGLSPQPGHMDDLKTEKFKQYDDKCIPTSSNDNCGVHILSGIPNKMAVHVIKNISASEATTLFYNVMTTRLKSDSKFADYKAALLDECKDISAYTCEVVEAGLKSVGL